MDKRILQEDVRTFLHAHDLTVYKLARMSRIEPRSLWSFMKKPDVNLSMDNFFRLWSILYGEQLPVLRIEKESAVATEK